MLWNLEFNVVPSVLTTAMIATEMPAAIKPYSIAVAPDSFLRNATNFDIVQLHFEWLVLCAVATYRFWRTELKIAWARPFGFAENKFKIRGPMRSEEFATLVHAAPTTTGKNRFARTTKPA
jgi:hypothetical protein